MILFSLIWYKCFRFLEKNAIAPDSFDANQMKRLNAFNAMALTLLFFLFNSMFFYFAIAKMLEFDLSEALGGEIIFIYIGFLLFVGFRCIMRNNNYLEVEKEMSKSKYKGIYGNVIIAVYIMLTLISFFWI